MWCKRPEPARAPGPAPSRAHAAGLIGLAVLSVLALAAPVGAASAAVPEAAPAARFPPSEERALIRIFDRRLEPLGLRVTRAVLQNPKDAYRSSPKGTHLAIYAEPTETFSEARYVETIVPSAQAFLPRVFKRWKGIKTFDICLEPQGDTREAPPPTTQVWVTRKGVGLVRWRNVTLAELLAVARAQSSSSGGRYNERGDVFVYISSDLHDDPAYQAADSAADPTGTKPSRP